MTDVPPVLTVTPTPAGFWSLRFTYNPVMVAGIKAAVPAMFRSYSAETMCWTIFARVYVDAIISAAQAVGYHVEDLTPPRPRQRPRETPRPRRDQQHRATWADLLLADLDPELHKKVVRALARVLHPDMGGDHRLMQQLNDADARTRRAS